MCTLPAEGVSFCLSAAAKSLLNKKADVKVSLLVLFLTVLYLLKLLTITQKHVCLRRYQNCGILKKPLDFVLKVTD